MEIFKFYSIYVNWNKTFFSILQSTHLILKLYSHSCDSLENTASPTKTQAPWEEGLWAYYPTLVFSTAWHSV